MELATNQYILARLNFRQKMLLWLKWHTFLPIRHFKKKFQPSLTPQKNTIFNTTFFLLWLVLKVLVVNTISTMLLVGIAILKTLATIVKIFTLLLLKYQHSLTTKSFEKQRTSMTSQMPITNLMPKNTTKN